MTMFKKACRRSWTLGVWSRRLDSGLLDLDSWTLDDWTLGLWTTGPLDFGRLDVWNLDSWTQDDRTLGLWTIGARKFFPFLVTSISFSLLVNVEFLIISSTLRLMYYGSAERAANDCYNTNLLELIL